MSPSSWNTAARRELLALSRAGRHAASDHLETAALAGVTTIGCRRAGGGLAGAVTDSNVAAGAELARSLAPDVVVFDGAVPRLPPVGDLFAHSRHDARARPRRVPEPLPRRDLGPRDRVGDVRRADIRVSLRLRATEPLEGRRTAVFTAGAAPVDHLDAEIVHVSRNLADRDALRAELGGIDAEVFLVELKAAAIDVVAEEAATRGIELVLAANDVTGDGLDEAVLSLLPQKVPGMTKPIILLIGGATGTGKSTVATEVAYRLGINRVTSTDIVRQTLRAFFAEEYMPSIHRSSFDAGPGDKLVDGFLEQTTNVLIAVEASIERALQEGWSMVLEGVHLVPGMLATARDDAVVVHCVLSIEDEEAHAGHFWIRDAASHGLRPMAKYLDRLDDIRRLQDFIVERARETGVPVIENTGVEQTVNAVIELVLATEAERLERV